MSLWGAMQDPGEPKDTEVRGCMHYAEVEYLLGLSNELNDGKKRAKSLAEKLKPSFVRKRFVLLNIASFFIDFISVQDSAFKILIFLKLTVWKWDPIGHYA